MKSSYQEKIPSEKICENCHHPLRSRSSQAKKKVKRSPIKARNHDNFFAANDEDNDALDTSQHLLQEPANVIDTSSGNVLPSVSSVDVHNNTTEPMNNIVGDSLHAMLNRKLESISSQLNQNSHELGEMKNEMLIVKRLVAKVEVLIKCRRESNSSDSDHDFLSTLQSFGLPITTKENLDNLEQKLKSEDEKLKLVRLAILFVHN